MDTGLALFLLALCIAAHAGALRAARRAVDSLFDVRAEDGTVRWSFPLATGRIVVGLIGWYFASAVLMTAGFFARGETFIDETSMRVRVTPSGPGAQAGLRSGDRILKVEGQTIVSWDALRRAVEAHGSAPTSIDVDRSGAHLKVVATPTGSPPKILVGPWVEHRNVSFGRAVAEGFVQPAVALKAGLTRLGRVFSKREAAELSGPVGIVRETSLGAREGFGGALIIAVLAIAQVLPFVALGMIAHELLVRRPKKA